MSSFNPFGEVEAFFVILIVVCSTTLFGIYTTPCFPCLSPRIVVLEGVRALALLGFGRVLESLDALEQRSNALAMA